MNEGDLISLVTLGAVLLVVTLWVVLQTLDNRRRLEAVRAAIEANQPEVAQALLATRWSHVALRALKTSATALILMVLGAFEPWRLSGLFLIGMVLLVGFVPVVVYATVRERSAGDPDSGLRAMKAAGWATCLLLVLMTMLSYAVLARGAVFLRLEGFYTDMQRLQDTPEGRDFAARVQKLTGAPVGAYDVTIKGHRGYACLSGRSYGMQSCGTWANDQIRFATVKPSYLNVYHIPDLDEFLVLGTARVAPSGAVVTDGFITTAQALGQAAPGARAP